MNPNREETLFHAALELRDAAARAAFLDRECAGDAALRGRIERLLQAETEAQTFLQQPAAPVTRALTPRPHAANAPVSITEQPGDTIGRYKLLQQVGEGGCGTVYMAEQSEPVRRKVALKVIKLGMDTKSVIARFDAERQALAMMDHPNIAKVLDAGATNAGRPYFVMELVRGIPITKYCDENNLDTPARLDLFIAVCSAIQHAHQKGIIHRDIKPSNILVTLHDGEPVPKVIDFGIAKATEARLTDLTLFTELNAFIGTPAYISPEQAEMSGLDIDTRSDIYSLGVLLYELLSGKLPFEPEALIKAGLDAMRRTLREVEPPKPSTRLSTVADGDRTIIAKHRGTDAAKLSMLLRGDLDWIVMKALEKNRTRRYESASAFAQDIKRHLGHEAVLACPPSAAYLLQKLVRRHRLAFAAGAAVAASLVIGVSVSTWLFFKEKDAREKAVQAETRTQAALGRANLSEADAKSQRDAARKSETDAKAERDAKEIARKDAEDISTFLGEVFQSPDPTRDGRTITVAETLDKAAKKLDDLTAQPARRAKLQATLGETYRALGLARQAIPLQEKARDYRLTTSGPEHPGTLQAMHNLAISYQAAGRRDEALKLGEEVLLLRRKVLGPEHPDTLWAMNNLAVSYSDAGRRDEALRLREEVLLLRRKVLGPEHPDTLGAMHNLALSYFDAGRRDETLKLCEEVLPLSRKVKGPEHPETLNTMLHLALSYSHAGRREEALKLREEVLLLYRKKLGPEHAATLAAMQNLTTSYYDAGRRDEALKLREEVLLLYRKALGPEHPATLGAMHNLANSYSDAGRRDEALKLREEVLTLRRKVSGPEHPNTLWAMDNLALSYSDAGRRDDALKLREELLPLRRKVSGPEHLDTLNGMHILANSYFDAGRKDEALKLREEVLALRRKALGPEHPETFNAMINLAVSYSDAGRRDEALKLREEVLPLRRKVNGPEHPDTLMAMHDLAFYYHDAGRRDEALKLREEVLPLRHKVNGPEHPDTLNAMINLALSYFDAGRRDEALKMREEVLPLRRKVSAPEHPDTLWAIHNLAISYRAKGELAKAEALEKEVAAATAKAKPATQPKAK